LFSTGFFITKRVDSNGDKIPLLGVPDLPNGKSATPQYQVLVLISSANPKPLNTKTKYLLQKEWLNNQPLLFYLILPVLARY